MKGASPVPLRGGNSRHGKEEKGDMERGQTEDKDKRDEKTWSLEEMITGVESEGVEESRGEKENRHE